MVDLEINIPYPFVTHGAVPVHVYDSVEVVTIGGVTCFVPGTDITSDFVITAQGTTVTPGGAEAIALSDYTSQAFGQTATITVDGTVPMSGEAYAWVHLDYGLKGTTSYAKVKNLTGCDLTTGVDDNDAQAIAPATLNICDNNTYPFSTAGSVTDSQSVQNNNVFKPIPASAASCWPVEAPEGTAARPHAPLIRVTSTSTVGLPRESSISRATMDSMVVSSIGVSSRYFSSAMFDYVHFP